MGHGATEVNDKSKNRLPLRALASLTGLNALSFAIGILQTVVIAWNFGATRTIEIFFAATTFQELLLSLSCNGQIGDLFTPFYHEIKATHGAAAAKRAFSAMTNALVLLSAIIACITFFFAMPIARMMVGGFEESEIKLCSTIFLYVIPLSVILIANSMFGNLMRAEHHYGYDERFVFAGRVLNLLSLLLLSSWLGVWALVLGLWLSAGVRCIGQAIYAIRYNTPIRFVLTTEYFDPRQVLFKVPLSLQHVASAQFFAMAMSYGLSQLPEGSYAAYSYAKRIHSKIGGLALNPVGIVFFNHLSDSLSQGGALLKSYAKHAFLIMIVIVSVFSSLIFSAGDIFLWILWGGDDYPESQVHETWLVLAILTVLLVFESQYLISRRTNLALKFVGRQYFASGMVLLGSAALCLILIPRFAVLGAVYVQIYTALATALVSYFITRFSRRDMAMHLPMRDVLLWSFAAILSCSVAHFLRGLAGIHFGPNKISLLLSGIWISLVTLTGLLLTAYLLGSKEVAGASWKITGMIRPRLNGR